MKSERLTVTRGLVELKTIAGRISKKINETRFVDCYIQAD